jgi:glycosyltransferase involved in cell wall biosynthesis
VAIEHIILDNCSTDDTAASLEDYRAKPGVVEARIIVERDKGQTDAINRGFRMATGEIVCWLNTDEYYEPGVLKLVAEYFESHPEVDVVYGNNAFVDAENRLLRHKREIGFYRGMLLYYGCFMPSCSTFVRRRIIDDGILLDDSFRVCMDLEWYTRIASRGYRIRHLDRQLASFTWHETNISTTYDTLRRQEIRKIRQQHGGLRWLPGLARATAFDLLACYWMGVRVMVRTTRRLQDRLGAGEPC